MAGGIEVGARDAGDLSHRAQSLRHLVGGLRSGQQNCAHCGRGVILSLLRRILRNEKEPARERAPERAGHLTEQARGRRKIHVRELEAYAAWVEIRVESHLHVVTPRQLFVRPLRVAAIIETLRSGTIVETNLAAYLGRRDLAGTNCVHAQQFRKALAHHKVRRVQTARA